MKPTDVGGGAAVAPAKQPTSKPVGVRRSFLIGLLVAFGLLVLAGFLISQISQQNKTQTQYTQVQGTPAPPPPQLHRMAIGKGAITVNASTYSYFTLTVPPGAFDVALKGRIDATGGSGNDIEIYVLGADEFTNWQNGHSVQTYYNSGRVTVADLNATLPNDAGTYYLVFNNKFSVFTPKAVAENMTLTYFTRQN